MTMWLVFSAVVTVLLIFDLGVINRRAHEQRLREAAAWCATLFAFASSFGLVLGWREGTTRALEYFAGYVIELSLSVDNLFVFLIVFEYFAVPKALQPRVLKWGILGALVMRGVMIALGVVVLQTFHWIIYVFGAFLVVTAVKMLRLSGDQIEPERNPIVRLAKRILPFTGTYEGQAFFVSREGRWIPTLLFLVLLVVEWTDLVFAVDSIPAVFGVTRDPFVVYSSNVFAVLGLRSLFFLLSGMLDRFAYLKPGIAIVLAFVGVKMIASAWFEIPIGLSLAVILVVLAGSVGLSMLGGRSARS